LAGRLAARKNELKNYFSFTDTLKPLMEPVIRFHREKLSPEIDCDFFKRIPSTPLIISVIGGLGCGKSFLINALLGLTIDHKPRRYQHDVFGVSSKTFDGDLAVLEWQLELQINTLHEVRFNNIVKSKFILLIHFRFAKRIKFNLQLFHLFQTE